MLHGFDLSKKNNDATVPANVPMEAEKRAQLTQAVIEDLITLMGEDYVWKAQAAGLVIEADACNENIFNLSISHMTTMSSMTTRRFEIEKAIQPSSALQRVNHSRPYDGVSTIPFSRDALRKAVTLKQQQAQNKLEPF